MPQVTLLSVDVATPPENKGAEINAGMDNSEKNNLFSQELKRQIDSEGNGKKAQSTAAKSVADERQSATAKHSETSTNNNSANNSVKASQADDNASAAQSNKANEQSSDSDVAETQSTATAAKINSSKDENKSAEQSEITAQTAVKSGQDAKDVNQYAPADLLAMLTGSGKLLSDTNRSENHDTDPAAIDSKVGVLSESIKNILNPQITSDNKPALDSESKAAAANQQLASSLAALSEQTSDAQTNAELAQAKIKANTDGANSAANKAANASLQLDDKTLNKTLMSAGNQTELNANKSPLQPNVVQVDGSLESSESEQLVLNNQKEALSAQTANATKATEATNAGDISKIKAEQLEQSANKSAKAGGAETVKQAIELSAINRAQHNAGTDDSLASVNSTNSVLSASEASAAMDELQQSVKPKAEQLLAAKTQQQHAGTVNNTILNANANEQEKALAVDAANKSIELAAVQAPDAEISQQIVNQLVNEKSILGQSNTATVDSKKTAEQLLNLQTAGSAAKTAASESLTNTENVKAEQDPTAEVKPAEQLLAGINDIKQAVAAGLFNSEISAQTTERKANESYSNAMQLEGVFNKQVAENVAQTKINQVQVAETINIHRKDFVDAVKNKVMVMISQKLQQVDIKLDPPELGNVHVRVNLQNDVAAVNFIVQNPQAKEALEQHMGKLRDMLSESGVDVGEANVSQQQKQNEQQGDFSEQNNNGGFGGDEQSNNSDDGFIATTLVKGSAGGVDFYA
ncbi:MAG: flagellar hook-length control protein FliK [Thalassotalea sp.]